MKSVYACTKPSGELALAIDIIAISDTKTVGALLKLAGEAGLLIDRVDPIDLEFEDRGFGRPDPTAGKDDDDQPGRHQLEIEFPIAPADGGKVVGPAEMGEGFACTYSGACPHENQSCTNCEYAGSIFPKDQAAEPEPQADPEGQPVVTEEQAAAWGEQMQAASEQEDELSDPIVQTEAILAAQGEEFFEEIERSTQL